MGIFHLPKKLEGDSNKRVVGTKIVSIIIWFFKKWYNVINEEIIHNEASEDFVFFD